MRDGYAIIPEIWRGLKNRNTVPEMDPQEEKGDARQMEDLHIRNFLDCVKSRQAPNADIEEGHLTATMCHLGNIATRLGRTLQWDATREQFIGDREANSLLTYRYRKPWDKYQAG
jgi:hypothetical protein